MKNQDKVICNFLNTLKILCQKGKVTYYFNKEEKVKHISNNKLLMLDNLVVLKNNHSVSFRIHYVENNYLQLAQIDSVSIVFDKTSINEAGEWNIINRETGFVITKTLSSFLNNKIWAWLDRSRCIWNEEIYKD
jgi:2-hydroxy-3-keto-5-methylthiopentenyl-1-phosphate phosphatase